MTLEVVRRWFERLPPAERDLPIIIYEGVAYSPRAILSEVERGTPTGEYLQRKLESGSLGTTEEELYRLALIRLKEILKRYPPNKPVIATLTYPPKALTPQEIIKEVEEGTPLGRKLVEAELQHMRYLLTLR